MAKNVLRGKNLIVEYGYQALPLSTSCKITLGTNTVDSTTKEDPEDWDDVDIGSRNWSITADRLLRDDNFSTSGDFTLGTLKAAATPVVGAPGTLVVGALGYSTEPFFLRKGERITINEFGSINAWLCKCINYAAGETFITVAKIAAGTQLDYTADSEGGFFVLHDAPHTIPHTYNVYLHRDMLAGFLDDLPIETLITVDIDGDQYTGNALITQHDLDGSVKQNQTHSLTITGTGELTKITN